jgi:hypothetical protein
VPMVTQLGEKRRRLWEMAKANLKKVQKWYKDFANKSKERWILKKGMKCRWTSKDSDYQKVWTTSSWAHMRVHSKCWKRNFPTLTN